MRAIVMFQVLFFLFFTTASAQQPTATAAGVAQVTEGVSSDIVALNSAKRDIRTVIRANQLGKKKKDRASTLVMRADEIQSKLTRYRKKYRKLTANILERELKGSSATKKQTAQFFRLFGKSSRFGNRGDSIIDKIRVFIAENPVVPTAVFRGTWRTNFGSITFTQNDRNRVNGTYLWNGGGTVTGIVKGNKLIGSYRGDGTSGSFVVVMDSSNSSWAGSYTTSDGTFTQAWTATRG